MSEREREGQERERKIEKERKRAPSLPLVRPTSGGGGEDCEGRGT